jgi:fused signal recognition particle receptor
MGFFSRISEGLSRSRNKFKEQMNVLLDRGPKLDEEFWENLEEVLILSDVGPVSAMDIVSRLRDRATRLALPDAYAVLDYLNDEMAAQFAPDEHNILGYGQNGEGETGDSADLGCADEAEDAEQSQGAVILFVGINGTGKTTTVGKLAKEAKENGRNVILGSADTFRAAAIEQLEVWANRADVEIVQRERGADPASVAFATLERAEETGADLVLIDTAGRLHTSDDLMRELKKVVDVTRRRSHLPVYTVLVIDATTGQNGLVQAREFDRALDLDAVILTKLDGTAKGGIALAVSHELNLPIIKIGVGEAIDDLRDFDAHEFVRALVGDMGLSRDDASEDADEDAAADDDFEE